MKITREQLQQIVREHLSESLISEAPVRLGPDARERIADARDLFGDEEFIERLTASIPTEILNKAINRMFGDVSAKVRGIQYF